MPDLFTKLRNALADRYTIEGKLGEGGMATVYLAEDLKHHRKVALKVLKPELAATLGAERFQREIQIAARLQHPHILPLLDSGNAEGFLYYAMPYVEGPSLRERLEEEGALPVGDAVRIVSEVVDALTEAHAHGVVHRDIKPENIMLRGRHALVTDFGVAKAVSEAAGQQTLTTAGVALGTPAYMAPEQASADPHLDHRVDIYAVGAVAYELLTGRPVFMGTTPRMVLTAHMTEVPVPIRQYREAVPAALEAVVMRCLAKQPADRWQSAEELLPQLESLATPTGGITPTQTQPVAAVRARRRLVAVAVGGGLIALAALAFLVLRPKPLTVTVSDITAVTSVPGIEFQPAISPDGKEVAFAAGPIGRAHLFVRTTHNLAGGADVSLGDTASGTQWLPAWSPDGQFVRFMQCPRGVVPTGMWEWLCRWQEVGRLGGNSRPIGLPQEAVNPAWSEDGARMAFAVEDTIFVASATAPADKHRVAVLTKGTGAAHSLAWSPDGKLIAFVVLAGDWLLGISSAWTQTSSIWVVDASGGVPQRVTAGDHLNFSPVWLDRDHLLFVSDRDGLPGVHLIAVGRNGARGEPVSVSGVSDPHTISLSRSTRSLAFAKYTVRQNIRAYPLDGPGPISIRDGRLVTSGNSVIMSHDVSPDGRFLVFDGRYGGAQGLFLTAASGGDVSTLTSLAGHFPRFSPDGWEVVFSAPSDSGRRDIMIMAYGGTPARLTTEGEYNEWPTWSPDGRKIVFMHKPVGSAAGSWAVSRDAPRGAWHAPVPYGTFCSMIDWAPDGGTLAARWCAGEKEGDLALVSSQGRVLEVRAPFSGGGADCIRYSRDGRTVYVVASQRDGRRGVWALPLAPGAQPRLVVAFDDPMLSVPLPEGNLSVSRDHVYLTVAEHESDIWVAKLRW